MPTGIAWNRSPDSVQSAVIRAFAQAYQKNDDDANRLLIGAFPATALELLPEWEESLGLPDPCSISESDTIAIRQQAVVNKLIGTGGQTKDYFIQLMASLGYDIEITEYRQARAGWSVAGEALNGGDWSFTWKGIAPDVSFRVARAGKAHAGDPLRSWGNKTLICLLSKYCPAHTIILIEFTGV